MVGDLEIHYVHNGAQMVTVENVQQEVIEITKEYVSK